DEEDLFSLIPYIDERFLVLSARAPLALGPGQYGWYHFFMGPDGIDRDVGEAEQSRLQIIAFIREAVEAYGADAARVYLMGFSQGAIMSLSVMLTEPELLAGVVAMSGMLPREVQPMVAAPERLKDFPVLVVHGVDDGVLPIQEGRALRQYLSQVPVRLDYREYPMRHQISDESLDDVCGWLKNEYDVSIHALHQ
ncbi:MAG: phospholipase, partial [Chloroflexi bacterium]|nr:phospholipase [Chloroflexota bacterium]